MKNIILLTAVAIGFTSCDVKDPIYNTDHPTTGRITLITDWTAVATDIAIPASYAIKIGDYSATLSGKTNTLSNLFAPGVYHANIYNSADKITVSGTTATVETTAGFVAPMPGWLMTSTLDATIEKDKDYNLTAVVKQQARQLTLVITPDGGTASQIASITATLSGVASKLNIDTDATSDPANVALVFAKQTDGSYHATVRLLGIVQDSEQKLTTTIAFTGGSPANVMQTSTITTLLAAFNNDKKTPMTLGSQAVETSTEAGFTCIITDWIPTTEIPGIAN